MYRFYDIKENGSWKSHEFSKDEAKLGFWIFFIGGFIIPAIIAFCSLIAI